jgi:CRP/FNR family transcriptional regulator, cyclic AMP receptor protein
MPQSDAITAVLARTDLFKELSCADLSACETAFRESRFAKGELPFARGDPGARLYLIADGRVRVAVVTDKGRELSFRHAAAGVLLGEIAALDGEPRSSDAVVLSPVTAYSLERGAFEQLYSTHGAVATSLIAFLCRRIRDTSGQLEAIALYPVEARLARFLLFALGNRQAAAGRRIPLELGFSQSELAQLLGANRPKVNAALSLFERAGAIGRTICDPVKLAQIAEGEEA